MPISLEQHLCKAVQLLEIIIKSNLMEVLFHERMMALLVVGCCIPIDL